MSARSSQLEAAYRREEEATNFMAEERVRRANAHASLAEERAGELEELLASSRAEAARLREEAEAAERVQASLKESNATLVAAYRRCESSTADSERRSAESAAEAALARRGAEALADELQSYKQQVRTLTRRIKTMVTKADHQHVQSLLQAARQELLDRGHATTAHTRGSVPSGFGERADASSPLGSLDDATSTGVATTLEATAVWVSSSDPLFRRGVPPLPPTHFTLRPRFLVARGASDDVPRFLRSNGLVRAHDLSKQDTERLIKACWSAKGKQEVMLRRQRGDDTLRVAMQDFFWDWLRVTFGGPGQAVEWGSSVVAALQKYAYDADVDVFLRCLQGRLPEDVYTQGNLLVERLEEGLQQRDRAISGGQKTGFLTVDDIRLHVRAAFPHKRPPAMTAVLAALAIDPAVQAASGGGISMAHAMESSEAAAAVLVGTERVDYVRLLAENAVGDQGPFVETLRAQLMSDFLEFTGDLTAALGRVATGPPDDRLVTAATALASIRSEDPAKPEQEVRALVARGLGVHISELDPESKRPVHLRAFLARLRAGWLERSGPLPPHRAAR